jgi:hypothetical protein
LPVSANTARLHIIKILTCLWLYLWWSTQCWSIITCGFGSKFIKA